MRPKHIPTVWIHPDKFEWLAKLKESLGAERFDQLSEDEKDKQAEALWHSETVKKDIRQLAEIIVEHYIQQKKIGGYPEGEDAQNG